MKLNPVSEVKNGELIDVYFDLSIIIDKDNSISVVDNTVQDATELCDCNTLLLKKIKISV